MESTKREAPPIEEQKQPELKRPKNNDDPNDSSTPQENVPVALNPADCNLDFNIEGDGITGHALHEEGFAYCWSGARGNIGITGGKYCFGCEIVSGQLVVMEDTPPDQQNVSRVGISRGDDPVGNLGETEHSYGFGGTGKFSNAGRFVDYGQRFGIGDTIVCLVDLESKPLGSIEFCKNGQRLGIAKYLDAGPKGLGVVDSSARKLPWESALFPHVLLKNTVVKMQFSIEEGLVPVEGYKPWASALKDGNAIIGPSLSDPSECEVIMMVGLPASGKTTWAEKWVKEHPEKRYVLLGTNLVLEQMKVPGLLRKHNYGERFDRLMDRATGIFNTLLSRASKVPRNYVIDQTNVYKSARKRKLKEFKDFHKIAVVVFPTPEQLKLRSDKRFKEMGKEVPPDAVDGMLANFVLPMSKDMRGTDEYFDKVVFTELSRDEAQQHLCEMKRALAMAPKGKSKSEQSPYSRESSLHSDARTSAYPLPGHGSGYPSHSPGNRGVEPGANWTNSPAPAMYPYSTNVITGYTRPGQQPSRVEPTHPPAFNVSAGYRGPGEVGRVEPAFSGGYYQGSVNPMPSRDAYQGPYSSYSSSYPPRADPPPYGSYMHDTYQRHEPSYSYTTPAGYMSDPRDTRAARQPSHQPPYGLPYDTPNQLPYATPAPGPYGDYPRNVQQPGPAPYGPLHPRYY